MKKIAKVIIPVFIVLIMGLGVFLGVTLVGRKQVFEQKAAPETVVYFTSDNQAPKVGEQFNVTIDTNTGANEIVGAELYLTFSNNVVQITNLSQGSFPTGAQIQTSTYDNTAGTVTYIIYVPTGGQPQTGTGSLGTISFRAVSEGIANITVGADSKVAAVSAGDVGLNVLSSTVPLNLTVLPESTPTPTEPAATGTNTPTPTATLTPTDTPTPTATTASGSGGNATNTPTATLTPTDTPTPTATTASGSGGSAATNTSTPTSTTALTSSSGGTGSTLPDAGISFPTVTLAFGSVLLIFFALLLAL